MDKYLQRRANRLGMIPFVEGSRDPEPEGTVGIPGFIQGAQDGYNYNKKGDNKMRDVKIKPVLNGWIVNVGCKDVVFDNMEKMLQELKSYILNPEKVEAFYMKTAVNNPQGLPSLGGLVERRDREVTRPKGEKAENVESLEGEESPGYGVRADDPEKTDPA